MEREGAKKNVLTFIHVRVLFSVAITWCNDIHARIIISQLVKTTIDTSVHLYPYLDMKYQDSRRRKICNRLEGIWRDEFTISNFRRPRINDPFFVIPGEREISSILIASYTLSKRNEITGSPTHPPGHFDAAQNAFGVRVCARVWVQTVYLRTRGRAQDKEV